MKKLYFLFVAGLLFAKPLAAQVAHVSSLNAESPVATHAPVVVIRPDSIFVNPEVLPQCTGGTPALQDFLAKNLRYPEQAKFLHAKGQALVRFMVEANGKISDATVVRGPGCGLNEEALRLVWFMPAWQPGRQNGQAVRTSCTLPISFQ